LKKRNEDIRRDKISLAFGGDKHPNWAGGKNRYRGKNWARQKRLALIRDDYTCQKCGITRAKCIKKYHRSPNVHHIKPYRFFNSYEKANDLENLITLCDGCHQKAEWEYRKKYHEEYEKEKSKDVPM
jgi:5-methylcytosine-specific restriction endonuclease McrA